MKRRNFFTALITVIATPSLFLKIAEHIKPVSLSPLRDKLNNYIRGHYLTYYRPTDIIIDDKENPYPISETTFWQPIQAKINKIHQDQINNHNGWIKVKREKK